MNLFDNGGRSGEKNHPLNGKLRYIPILLIVFLLALGGGRLKFPGSSPVPGSAMEEEDGEETSQEETAQPETAEPESPAAPPAVPAEAAEPESTRAQDVTVYVCGSVRYPGVYQVSAEGRVMDAVNAAGGFLDDADPEYWNLAEPLADGEQIRIPSREESESLESRAAPVKGTAAAAVPGAGGSTAGSSGGLVNLNTADLTELQTLSGIGASRAAAIIAYREENGPFRTIEDIMNVSGIKEGSFAKIKDYITV